MDSFPQNVSISIDAKSHTAINSSDENSAVIDGESGASRETPAVFKSDDPVPGSIELMIETDAYPKLRDLDTIRQMNVVPERVIRYLLGIGPGLLRKVRQIPEKIQEEMISADWQNVSHICNPTRAILEKTIGVPGAIRLYVIKEQTPESAEIALAADPQNITYVSNPTAEMLIPAIRKKPSAITLIPNFELLNEVATALPEIFVHPQHKLAVGFAIRNCMIRANCKPSERNCMIRADGKPSEMAADGIYDKLIGRLKESYVPAIEPLSEELKSVMQSILRGDFPTDAKLNALSQVEDVPRDVILAVLNSFRPREDLLYFSSMRFIRNIPEDIQELLIDIDWTHLEYIQRPARKILLKVFSKNMSGLGMIHTLTSEIVDIALSVNAESLDALFCLTARTDVCTNFLKENLGPKYRKFIRRDRGLFGGKDWKLPKKTVSELPFLRKKEFCEIVTNGTRKFKLPWSFHSLTIGEDRVLRKSGTECGAVLGMIRSRHIPSFAVVAWGEMRIESFKVSAVGQHEDTTELDEPIEFIYMPRIATGTIIIKLQSSIFAWGRRYRNHDKDYELVMDMVFNKLLPIEDGYKRKEISRADLEAAEDKFSKSCPSMSRW